MTNYLFDRKKLLRLFLGITVLSSITSIYLGTVFYHAYHAHKQQLKELSIKSYSLLADKINTMHHTRLHFLISLIICVTCVILMITKAYSGNRKALWITASAYSLATFLAITTIWHIELSYQTFKKHDNIIENQHDLDVFMKRNEKEHPSIYQSNHHIVPMGILAYAIEVKPNNDAKIDTYAWAKYDNTKDKVVTQPFKMANKEVFLTPNTFVQDNKTILTWNTNIISPQSFDFKKYPFDKQEIDLDFYHPNYIENVILIPELSAYDPTIKFPQLRPDIKLPRWEIDDAYFYYTLSDSATDFGIRDNQQMKNFPYLHYVIEVHRNILNPLISTLLPILIVLFILFCVLLILGNESSRASLPSIVGLLSGLFFATLISDQTFDRTINAPYITYFKSFYYIIYCLIFLVSVNCFLYLFRHIRWIQYEHNFIARLLFWPVASTIFFGVTLIFFYTVTQ